MCRAWPGFRCSNHPSKKIRSAARTLWNEEKRLERATARMEAYAEETGEDWETTEKGKTLLLVNKEAIKQVEVERENYEAAVTEYNLTLKGREELSQKEQSDDPKEATAAAAQLNAAETRIQDQKDIAAILQNPNVTMAEKVYTAQRYLRLTQKELVALRRDHATNNNELQALLRVRAERQEQNSDLTPAQKEDLARLMKEDARLTERIKQAEAHESAILSWISRTLDKGFEDALKMNEKFSHKMIDFII